MSKQLSELKPGEQGVVVKVKGNGPVYRRIVDMGIVPGANITVLKYAPLGDPIEIKVKGFNLSLRKSEASMIQLEGA
ncbi:FeoA family protein [Propionispora hippei]|uniref:Ferrous iron transport protein A n=1 Tax=Propionispora hippei DSM 15287 TaxID=1123003 RepID=A0A1M6BKF8_9FIRM|nr:FeoA family protein [Propionispora hippei]SHI49147.1 ferrous iron transport protein A [Propionispora hippei DSM 15287]